MADESVLAFSFPAIHGRKVTAAFDALLHLMAAD
jgi:hypothetical protein